MRAGEAEALLRAAIRKAAVPGLHVRPQLSQLSTLFHLTFLKIFAAAPEQKGRVKTDGYDIRNHSITAAAGLVHPVFRCYL